MIGFLQCCLVSLTLAWNANSEPDLAGYQVYWRTSPASTLVLDGPWSSVTNVGNVTNWTTKVEPNQFWCFVVTAYNQAGAESDYSRMVFVIFVRPTD